MNKNYPMIKAFMNEIIEYLVNFFQWSIKLNHLNKYFDVSTYWFNDKFFVGNNSKKRNIFKKI